MSSRSRLRKRSPETTVDRTGRGAGDPKKGRSVLCEKPGIKYAFMLDHSDLFKVTAMCRVLGATRSGFSVWRQRQKQPSVHQQQRDRLD